MGKQADFANAHMLKHEQHRVMNFYQVAGNARGLLSGKLPRQFLDADGFHLSAKGIPVHAGIYNEAMVWTNVLAGPIKSLFAFGRRPKFNFHRPKRPARQLKKQINLGAG